MASSTDDSGRDKLMWIAGTAAVTAFVVYQMNKYLRDKEDLAELKAFERMQSSPESTEE